MLKRDLNIERLRAEESNQAAKMTDAKMEALASEYETRLHDAAINKTLLKRRERQVADFKDQIETEKQKAAAAIDRELGWRQAMEKCELESKQKVEEAQLFAALMEGRNNTLTSHWKEQGDFLEQTLAGLREKFDAIVEERKKDDIKFNMLKSLSDQQAEQLQALSKEKDGIFAALEAYKAEQEFRLKDIKETAAAREKENDKLLEQSKKLLGELKWALAVKENVK
jgi:preprotein translocase subunit SecD